MSRRKELHAILVEKIGDNKRVYYQPPENLNMEYPCIRYSKIPPAVRYADDKKYISKDKYQIIVLSKNPDEDVISSILDLPLSSYESHYISDNLYHDIINVYY